jgi:hypothetical protein
MSDEVIVALITTIGSILSTIIAAIINNRKDKRDGPPPKDKADRTVARAGMTPRSRMLLAASVGLCVSFLIGVAWVRSRASNIPVPNHDFAQVLPSWEPSGDVAPAEGRSSPPGVSVTDKARFSELSQTLSNTFTKDTSYRASVWCKTNNGNYCSLLFGDIEPDPDQQVGEHTGSSTVEGTGEWKQLVVCVSLIKNERMSIYLDSRTDDPRSEIMSNDGKIYDDVSIQEVGSC